MNLLIQAKLDLLDQLYHEVDFNRDEKEYTVEDIDQWMARCVSLFSELGVPDFVMEGFVHTFDHAHRFIEQGGVFKHNPSRMYVFRKSERFKLTYHTLAFEIAKQKCQQVIDKSRIVPLYLIDALNQCTNASDVVILLEKLQLDYEGRGNLLSILVTLLEAVLDKSSDLKGLSGIMSKLSKISDKKLGKVIREQFGEDDTIRYLALTLGYIPNVRNYRVIHPPQAGILSTNVTLYRGYCNNIINITIS